MKTNELREDLIFVAALVLCQLLNIVAFACGALHHIALVFAPMLSIIAVVMFKYAVMIIKLIIVAIKYKNHNE